MPKEILKQVRKIEFRTKNLIDGLMAGAYHSIFRGQGIEFSEVREYVIGDDVNSIDWNVTARMNQPFIKEFIEERDLRMYVVMDISGSGDFGKDVTKKEKATIIAATLMFSALRNNDMAGLILFSDKVERFVPARKGKRHMLKMIREMLYYEPTSKKTDIMESLSYAGKLIKRKSIVFVISDFYSGDFSIPLKKMRSKHDVIAINLNDIREYELPDVGYIELEDAESGEQILVDTSDRKFRERYEGIVKDEEVRLVQKLRKLKIDLIQIRSDEGFEVPLKKFFAMRERRMVR